METPRHGDWNLVKSFFIDAGFAVSGFVATKVALAEAAAHPELAHISDPVAITLAVAALGVAGAGAYLNRKELGTYAKTASMAVAAGVLGGAMGYNNTYPALGWAEWPFVAAVEKGVVVAAGAATEVLAAKGLLVLGKDRKEAYSDALDAATDELIAELKDGTEAALDKLHEDRVHAAAYMRWVNRNQLLRMEAVESFGDQTMEEILGSEEEVRIYFDEPRSVSRYVIKRAADLAAGRGHAVGIDEVEVAWSEAQQKVIKSGEVLDSQSEQAKKSRQDRERRRLHKVFKYRKWRLF